MFAYSGKVVVFTGIARGTGFTCAERHSKCGSKTILLDCGLKAVQEAGDILGSTGICVEPSLPLCVRRSQET